MSKEDIKYLELLKEMIDENYKDGKKYIQAIENVINRIQSQQKEIEKKDKIIDKVYDFIWENDCCRYFSKKHTLCNQVLNFDSCLGNCKRNCIKQYFEKKVEESNEIYS